MKCSACSTEAGEDYGMKYDDSCMCNKCFEEFLSHSCSLCHQGIEEGDKKVTKGIINWHDDCFKCSECRLPISKRGKFFVRNGAIVCRRCAEDVDEDKLCSACNQDLVAGYDYVELNGQVFHEGCLKCHYCKDSLKTCKFQTEKDHYICQPCHKAGKSVELVKAMLDPNKAIWLTANRCCSNCFETLSSRSFFVLKGSRCCFECHSKR